MEPGSCDVYQLLPKRSKATVFAQVPIVLTAITLEYDVTIKDRDILARQLAAANKEIKDLKEANSQV